MFPFADVIMCYIYQVSASTVGNGHFLVGKAYDNFEINFNCMTVMKIFDEISRDIAAL